MQGLTKYDAAVRALAECRAVDEIKDWHDKAAAMQEYGKQAQDKTLETTAAEIRIRAERRLGEILAATEKNKGAKGVGKSAVVSNDRTPTLADAGISKDLSARAQKLAAVSTPKFEAELGEWRERVSAEGARVTARLEVAGEAALVSAQPKTKEPTTATVSLAIYEALMTERNELKTLLDDMTDLVSAQQAFETGSPQSEILSLKTQLRAVEKTRDKLMTQNVELKQEVAALKASLKKVEAKAKADY